MSRLSAQQAATNVAADSETIMATVCAEYEISQDVLLNHRKHPLHVEARQVAIVLLTKRGMSRSAIGRVMRRDHSTVHYHATRPRSADAAAMIEMCEQALAAQARRQQKGVA